LLIKHIQSIYFFLIFKPPIMNYYSYPIIKTTLQRTAEYAPKKKNRYIIITLLMLFSMSVSAQDTAPPVLIDPATACSSLDRLNVAGCYKDGLNFDGNSLTTDVAALYTDPSLPVSAVLINTTAGQNNSYCSWSFTYTYRIQDGIGNFVTCEVTRSGNDQVLPTFTLPADITLYENSTCDFNNNPLPAVSGDVTDAADNCGILQVIYADCENRRGAGAGCSDECLGTRTIERTWRVFDSCGNLAEGIQLITIRDTTAPVFTNCPANFTTFNCDNVTYNAEATDNCISLVNMSYVFTGATTGSGSGTGSGSVFLTGVTHVTVTATDDCGNSRNCTFDVTASCSSIDMAITAAITRSIYRGTVSGFGPFGPQSIPLSTTITGGTAPYTYDWSPATGLNNSHIANPVANPASTTTYTLTVTDHVGRTRSLSITINVLQLSSAVCSGSGNNTKFDVCYNQQNICVSGNQVPQKLANGGYLGPCSENSVTTVIDIDICAAITRTIYSGTVSGYGPFGPQSINLSSIATGGTPGYTYHWSPVAGLSDPNIANPVASPLSTTTYTLTVTDNNSGSRSLSITIKVLPLSSAVCSGNGNNVKFKVCHIPPGNPSNGHNICISRNALNAHLIGGGNGHNNCHLGPCGDDLCFSTIPAGGCQAPTTAKSTVPFTDATDEEEQVVEVKNEFNVQVYPNPSSTDFNVQVFSKSNEPVTVRILDNSGVVKSVSTISSKTNSILVGNNLPRGVYVAEVIQGNNRQVVKLIKLN
jgi:hypothetical protein